MIQRTVVSILFVALAGCFAGAAVAAESGSAAPSPASEYSAKMAHEHAGEAPSPTPAAMLEPAAPVVAEEVEYATFDGVKVKGYLAQPKAVAAGGPPPGILVIQEWWGLNDNIRAMTRRFAGEGYIALAVDLYDGKVATDADGAKALMSGVLANPARGAENLRQARAFLATRAKPDRIGVVGWCFGGGWSLATALDQGDQIDAAVMYYGRVVTDAKELAALKAPLLGLFGGKDNGIPVESVREMERVLQSLGKEATIVVYPDADHAFANPSGTHYDANAAADAWGKSTAFFSRHLIR